jgi:hypothetical protein
MEMFLLTFKKKLTNILQQNSVTLGKGKGVNVAVIMVIVQIIKGTRSAGQEGLQDRISLLRPHLS